MKKIIQFSALLVLAGCVYSPKPYSLYEVDQMSRSEYSAYQSRFDEIDSIDLYKAIAFGIKHNSNQRVQQLESVISEREQLINGFELLPELSANAGYKTLNELNPSTSSSYNPETDTFKPIVLNNTAYSVSEDLETTSGSGGITWNALDFGLSYVRAAQGADKMLITQELKRKATHNLVREIINAYFKAYSAELALSKIKDLKERSREALQDSAYIEELLVASPMDALFYQKELLDILKVLSEQERALINAKVELSVLMGIPLNRKYKLIKTRQPLTEVNLDLESMEELALNLRPELMESRYQSRIARNEVRASIMSAMPTLSFTRNWSYSDSSFLYNESNYDYGANIGFNFISMFSAPARIKNSKTTREIEEERRMSLYMTVLSQLHIALSEYSQNYQDYSMARHYEDVANRIFYQTLQGEQAASFGEIETIREEVSLLVASLKKESAYANLQYGIAKVLTSIGLDYVPYELEDLSEQEIADLVKNNLAKIMRVYDAEILFPIDLQSPIMTVDLIEYNDEDLVEFSVFTFQIDQRTFYLSGPGEIRYKLLLANGDQLPRWLSFNPSTLEIIASPGNLNVKSIQLELIAENDVMSASDKFTLLFEELDQEPKIILPVETELDNSWDTTVKNDPNLVSNILQSDESSKKQNQENEFHDYKDFQKSNFYGFRVGAFGDPQNINAVTSNFLNKGFRVFTQINSNSRNLTNIVIGPYHNLEDLEEDLKNMREEKLSTDGLQVSWLQNEVSIYYYRLGIFRNINNLNNLSQDLYNFGFESTFVKSKKFTDAKELWVGPFINVEELYNAQDQLEKIANIQKGYLLEFTANTFPFELEDKHLLSSFLTQYP